MLTTRLKNIIITLVIILVLAIGLYIGFDVGFRFIRNQDARQRMAEQARIYDQAATPTIIDAEGQVIELTPTPMPRELENVKPPKHIRQDTPGAIEVYVERGWGSEEIADYLLEKGVIEDRTPFIVMAFLNGFDGSYQMGTHFVLKGMDYNEIMYNLSLPAETTQITFYEGYSYIDIKEALREHGVNFDEEEMDRLVNTPSLFTEYEFITSVPTERNRYFTLEGYLFPDTYRFDLNASEEEIIRTFLRNTENKLTDEIIERAAYLEMSLDEVITLASVIQNEAGNLVEMYEISRVFHNRLLRDDLMQSCATTNYLRQLEGKEKVWYATTEDLQKDNPYNTYMYGGLPEGPIGNAGYEAILASVYPDTQDTDLYFFVAKGDGTNAFATNYDEHVANIERYREFWTDIRN